MNILTKLFVVLVAVLSMALVALVVPFVYNTENYKAQYEGAVKEARTAEATARLRQSELQALQDKQSQQIALLKAQAQNLSTQVNDLTQDLKRAEAAQESERAKNFKLEADFSRLTSANDQQSQIMKALQSELSERRQEMQDQQVRTIQLADRNNELQSQLETLNRNLRRIQEQMVELRDMNAQYEGMLAKLSPEQRAMLSNRDEVAEAPPWEPVTTEPIRGVVTGVSQLHGETFLKVNVGRADGVASNMKFLVHRGEQFLGTLVITTVDDQEAAGRLSLAQGTVATGDAVLTGGVQ